MWEIQEILTRFLGAIDRATERAFGVSLGPPAAHYGYYLRHTRRIKRRADWPVTLLVARGARRWNRHGAV